VPINNNIEIIWEIMLDIVQKEKEEVKDNN
jgi:hypothetical protein